MSRGAFASPPAVRIRDLDARYGRSRVLSSVDLTVGDGEVYALLGRNGAGKTTLVRCLLGHRRAAAGRVELLGGDAWRDRRRLLDRVGVVPEQPDAPPEMSPAELGRFFSRLYSRWDAPAYAARLERLRLPAELAFRRLSRGQKAQVALSLALASRPRLLVLDDPTLGLDAAARRSIFDELIGELAERRTSVFLATHDLAGIEGVADRVGILDAGRLLVDEPLARLKARFRRLGFPAGRPPDDALLAPFGPLAMRRRPWGVEAVVSGFDGGHGELPEGVAAEALTLEEIFVALAGDGPAERTP